MPVLKTLMTKMRLVAWLAVAAVAVPLAPAGSPATVASMPAAKNYVVVSRIVALGPGHYAIRGYVDPRQSGLTLSLTRRSCLTCDWVEIEQTATRDTGSYVFRVDAPSADPVHYRVQVPTTLVTRPTYSSAYRVDPLPEALDADLPFWGKPVWHDEFDGSAVDTSKWRVHDRDRTSYDSSSLYKEQAKVRDGKLVLTAKRVDPTKDLFGRSWASAYLDTKDGKFSQRYGRFEILARLPTRTHNSTGLWPSFWLRDDKGPGEIDVMEAWGTPSAKPAEEDAGNYAWTVHSDTMGGGTAVKSWGLHRDDPSIARGYYRYAVEWTPDGIKMFLNDKQVGYVSRSANPWLDTSFPTKANIRLHFAVGNSYWGQPTSDTESPAEYVIEYVRVWKYPGA